MSGRWVPWPGLASVQARLYRRSASATLCPMEGGTPWPKASEEGVRRAADFFRVKYVREPAEGKAREMLERAMRLVYLTEVEPALEAARQASGRAEEAGQQPSAPDGSGGGDGAGT